jgi:starvation-inducible DNA-binding protein
MSQQSNIDSLTQVLGETFGLYVQTHGYHWNVEGPQFRQLHMLFEEQYQSLWAALDEIAERIRCLGAYAPGSLSELMARAAFALALRSRCSEIAKSNGRAWVH